VIVGAAAQLGALPEPPRLALGALGAFYLFVRIFFVDTISAGTSKEEHAKRRH